ncbi:MAG: carboxypeptidase-like regulatory domain-containing protein [Algibacter sp.]
MKHLIFIAILFISVTSFAQSNTTLNGKLTDLESNNTPLMYAKVMIKETGIETLSDEKGLFKLEDLQAGYYTLVYSFTGYETKEVKIKVKPGKANHIDLALGASTISLEDLMLVMASSDN